MLYKNNKVSFEILCTYGGNTELGSNECDESLKKHRSDADETGYDADMEFRYWIDNSCVVVEYDLFGLEFTLFSIPRNHPEILHHINIANELIHEWFSKITLDDICEDLYRRVEVELGKKIFERLNAETGTRRTINEKER